MPAIILACGDDGGGAATPTTQASCGSETPAGASQVSFGETQLFVEIADTSDERHKGLSNRGCLGDDWGMLFVFANDVQSTFSMRETLIPLSIAFIAADGKIIEIEDMEPLTTELHGAPAPYRYAIEANQGWFANAGIGAGDVASIPQNIADQ
jgi:uncharacterized membrane protein (UPF0127 family)